MHVTFLGTGSAMPVPERAQTGLLLEHDDRTLLVDCGSGILRRLTNTEVGYEGVGTVLLTHHHLDHVADLLPLIKARWLAGEEFLQIIGPTGTKELIDGLLDVHEYLDGRCELAIREVSAGETFSAGGFDVVGRETRHSKPCLAYRFAPEDSDVDAADGPFTFSGDSEAFRGLASFADGSRVLAHDCSFPDGVDVSNHPNPTQLGEALAGTDVDHLYLTHLYPITGGKEEEMVESVTNAGFEGDVGVAQDGLRFEL
ncbi:MBL fold metallo-hydrolase [Haloparvum sp. PAK95]|uniref:MBL fold metallo-hydrolase n=1 Tax=Haloparvum sp. PAK95 TaxID=3418962 RepID=UPI003D2F4CC6